MKFINFMYEGALVKIQEIEQALQGLLGQLSGRPRKMSSWWDIFKILVVSLRFYSHLKYSVFQ